MVLLGSYGICMSRLQVTFIWDSKIQNSNTVLTHATFLAVKSSKTFKKGICLKEFNSILMQFLWK